jgi:hypothetical protein
MDEFNPKELTDKIVDIIREENKERYFLKISSFVGYIQDNRRNIKEPNFGRFLDEIDKLYRIKKRERKNKAAEKIKKIIDKEYASSTKILIAWKKIRAIHNELESEKKGINKCLEKIIKNKEDQIENFNNCLGTIHKKILLSKLSVANAQLEVDNFLDKINGDNLDTGDFPTGDSLGYINKHRIDSLKIIKDKEFDFSRLILLCEEINRSYPKDRIATIALIRTILNHVPPIFDPNFNSFKEVVSNYSWGKSIKGSMENLENSSRNIADHHLHKKIEKNEILPTPNQVDFSQDLDVLLAEIIKIEKNKIYSLPTTSY